MSCVDLTHAPVATAARAAATGRVGMSTRPDPERYGAVEIATRRCPRLRVVLDLRELTHQQKRRLWSLPARLGPVAVHPTRWGLGPQPRAHDYHSDHQYRNELHNPRAHLQHHHAEARRVHA